MALQDLVKKRLELLLNSEDQVQAYLKAYGPTLDMAKVQLIKDCYKPAAAQGAVNTVGAPDEATFQLQVKCPICGMAGIQHHEIKAKTLSIVFDRYFTPRYEPMKGIKALNYSLYSVTVCPKCLFASPDKRDFITYSLQTRSDVKSQLGPFVLEELKNRIDERKRLLEGVKDYAKHFEHPRSVASAIDAYRLAIHRALGETTLDVPLSWYKAGMYQLKIAMFVRDAGSDDETMCMDAVKKLSQAYLKGGFPNPDLEYQLLHILVALQIRIKDFTGAQTYLGALDKIKAELIKAAKVDPEIKTASIEKWTETTKNLWADREDPELWKH